MKRLQSNGIGSTHKQAEPITVEEEELMWESKVLGDHCPQSLLNTMIYMNGLYFALRSGEEHRSLRRSPCQIEVVERPGERAYLVYREDISKNHPGGLKGHKVKPKIATHHANAENPARCFVRLFKLYLSVCPSDAPAGAFYLSPLKTPKTGCWFSISPIGKNKLSKAIANMCKECGIQGYKTNYSLRATAATRLYMSGIDEQLVMERTGHRSTEGIRSYKHTTMEQKEVVSDVLSTTKRQCKQVAVREKPAENEASNTDIMTSSNHYSNNTNLSLPTTLSKSGAFYFSSCTNVNIISYTEK